MKRTLAFAFMVACGGAAVGAPAVNISKPEPLVSAQERERAACSSTSAGTFVASAEAPAEHRIVKSVTVVDDAGQVIETKVPLPIQVGASFEASQGHDAIRALWKTGRFSDVVLETKDEGVGVGIVFRALPHRLIDRAFVSGLTTEETEALHLRAGSRFAPVSLFAAARSIEGTYRERGYLDAAMSLGYARPGQMPTVDVCVRMTHGPLVTIDALRFVGTTHEAMLAALVTSDHGENAPGGVLEQDVLDRDVLIMSAKLWDLGLVESTIALRKERKGDRMTLYFDVKEGDVFFLGALDFRGDLLAPKADYQKLLSVKPGDVFSRSKLVTDIEHMRQLHEGMGRKDVEIEPQTDLDATKHIVTIHFNITDPKHVAGTPIPTASPTAFKIQELAPGRGAQVKAGDHVSVHYTGTLLDGTVFDSSRTRNTPFDFEVGGHTVIAGFEKGVTGMRVGGKRRVTIPPDMGYGSRAMGSIPANATLVFEIELLGITP